MNECLHPAYDVPTGRCPDCGETVVTESPVSDHIDGPAYDSFGPKS